MSRLVLASASCSRQMLLRGAGVDFLARPADIDEDALTADLIAGGAPAAEIALALAEQKAVMVSRLSPGEPCQGQSSGETCDRTIGTTHRLFVDKKHQLPGLVKLFFMLKRRADCTRTMLRPRLRWSG